jgi:hypothetical protein
MPLMTQSQFQALPSWLREPYQRLVQNIERQAQRPFSEYRYGEPRLAEFPEDITEARERIRGMTGETARDLSRQYGFLGASERQFPNAYQEYMNPYQQAVLDRIALEGKRSFEEDIMPQLEAKFTRLGQHGSKRHADLARRAARDVEKEIADRQAQSLAQGYQQAAQIFSADQARALETTRELANLAAMKQAAEMADISALEAQGRSQMEREQAQRDLAYQDWLREKEHESKLLAWQAAMMQGIPSEGIRVGAQGSPGTPQMNTMGNIGQLAGNILAARMATGR